MKRIFRTLLIVSVVAAMLLSLVSCGGSKPKTHKTDAYSIELPSSYISVSWLIGSISDLVMEQVKESGAEGTEDTEMLEKIIDSLGIYVSPFEGKVVVLAFAPVEGEIPDNMDYSQVMDGAQPIKVGQHTLYEFSTKDMDESLPEMSGSYYVKETSKGIWLINFMAMGDKYEEMKDEEIDDILDSFKVK